MINDKESVFNERKMSLKEYRKIKLTDEEIARAETLTTEIQIDQFTLGIINNRWDN